MCPYELQMVLSETMKEIGLKRKSSHCSRSKFEGKVCSHSVSDGTQKPRVHTAYRTTVNVLGSLRTRYWLSCSKVKFH